MHVEAESVALVEVVVEHRREQVVGGGDGMEVAGEVEVELLHRYDLAVAATGRPALDAEGGAHAGLAQGKDRRLADVLHRLAEADCRGGLAFAERSRSDRRDYHVLGLGAIRQLLDGLEADLGDIVAVVLEEVWADAHLGGDS